MDKVINKNTNKWLIATLVLTALLIIGEVVSSYLISNPSKANGMGSLFASTLALSAFFCLVFSIFATLKVGGYTKVITISCGFIALAILCLAAFAASFSQLGTY